MSVLAALVLGILIGWLIEWIIDWVYWRGKTAGAAPVVRTAAEAEPAVRAAAVVAPDHSAELDQLKRENASLNAQLQKFLSVPDDLKVIKGIGPEIERRLNAAGVTTFAQLGDLTPADLERILGDVIKRLANEEVLLSQARELARKSK